MAKDLQYTLSLKDLFSKQMRGAVDSTKMMDAKVSSLDSSFTKLGGVIAGAFSAGSVISFGNAVIESLKNYEYFHAGLKTMLHGNSLAANALETQLVNLAKTTPFELTEVQTATKQLLAYGFKAGDVVDTMRTLGDVSSGIGAPLGDIAYLYGTLKTSGRVTLMDLRQFAGRGIPIYETLAKRLNTTTNGINKMVHDGKLGFADIEGAFKDMTKEGGSFFNLMANQSKTDGGRISNLGDSWEQLKINTGKSQSGIIATTVDFLGQLVGSLSDYYAQANRLAEQFKKTNTKGDSFTDKLLASVGLGSGLAGRMTGTDTFDLLQQKIVNASEYSTKQKLSALDAESKMLSKQIAERKISQEVGLRRASIIAGAIDQLRGLDSLKSQKEQTTGLGGEALNGDKIASLGKTATSSGVNISAQRPQSLVINITELVHELKIQANDLKDSTIKIKEEVTKIFLEMVNEANIAAR